MKTSKIVDFILGDWKKELKKDEDKKEFGYMSSCCDGRADEDRCICLVCGEPCDLIEDK